MKKIIKELYPYVVIVIVVVLFRTFIATPVRVDGDSMKDTLYNNDILILNKLDKTYERFDVVVIDYNNTKLVKRIIGLPGENISYKNNELYINNEIMEDVQTSRTGDFSLEEKPTIQPCGSLFSPTSAVPVLAQTFRFGNIESP